MLRKFKHSGFSLTEVLLAAGILAIGFMLVATTFPVGIKLTTVATERTIAGVATDEALAKMKIYGVDPTVLDDKSLRPFEGSVLLPSRYAALASVLTPQQIEALLDTESLYPSTEFADVNAEAQKYHWSGLLKLKSGTVDTVQAVVFVSRKAGIGVMYPDPVNPLNQVIDWPEPIEIMRWDDPADPMGIKEIVIDDVNPENAELAKFITDDAVIVDDKTGERMQVLRREFVDPAADAYPRRLILVEAVDETQLGQSFWVIPTGLGSSRNPCITVEPGGV
jgi:prepilin-type N-terminal cleavage/methylation domain-containing protein